MMFCLCRCFLVCFEGDDLFDCLFVGWKCLEFCCGVEWIV